MLMHTGKKRGFTLIELMLIIAIVGILAAIAIPAYQDYMILSQAQSGLRLVEGLEGTMETYHRRTGTWPTEAMLHDWVVFPMTNRYVGSVSVLNNGVIEIEFDGNDATPPLRMTTLDITPYSNAQGDVMWQCGAHGALSAAGSSAKYPKYPSAPSRFQPHYCGR
jgi:type IV pilus assembly protein PilA